MASEDRSVIDLLEKIEREKKERSAERHVEVSLNRFREKIVQYKKDHDLTSRDMADKLGVPYIVIGRTLRTGGLPTVEMVLKARFLLDIEI